MPQCCAFGCYTKPEKGIKFHKLPSEAKRRKMWLQRISRKDWNPSVGSRLCEKHFTPDQYERNRADGLKKLKPYALPSIFVRRPPPKLRKPPAKRNKPDNERAVQVISENTSATPVQPECEPEVIPPQPTDCQPILQDTSAEEKIFLLTRQLRSANREIKALNEKLENFKKGVDKVFGEDQMAFLQMGSMRGTTWSDDTIQKALKLRLCCGLTGYNYLIDSGHPLPSEHTVRLRIEH